MKTCPECKANFSRLKKGGCPNCGTPLFYSKGKPRRESDKVLAAKLREMAKPVIEKNTGVGGYSMLEQEWVFAYRFIDTLRAWLGSQSIKILTIEELTIRVLEWFLNDTKYWKANIRSLAGPAKQCVQVAMILYRDLKIQAAKENTQQQRVNNASINQLNISYE